MKKLSKEQIEDLENKILADVKDFFECWPLPEILNTISFFYCEGTHHAPGDNENNTGIVGLMSFLASIQSKAEELRNYL